MRKFISIFVFLVFISNISFACGHIFNPENGHYYKLYETLVSWHEAEALAAADHHYGTPGYLCTITSQSENDFVFNEVLGGVADTPMGDPWLGGYQNPVESPGDMNWYWVTEEVWDYTNWDDGEPNDYDEPYAEKFLNFQLWGGGTWNDHHGLIHKYYIVEYSTDVVSTENITLGGIKSLFQ